MRHITNGGREVSERLRCNPWLVLALVAFGEFMVVLDATIVNVALPSIQEDLGFSSTDLQWVINGYALMFGGFLLLGGRAADLFGRRRVFMSGLFVFTFASIANALATSPEVLVAGRGLQGLGAAMVSPAALSIITSTFPKGPERTKALSIWAGIAAGGGGAGLLLGGLLTDALSWEWVFLINVPVGIAAFVLTRRFVPESRLVERRGFDVLGAVAVTAGLLALVFAIVKAETWGFGDARVLAIAGTAALLISGFLIIEARLKDPLVDLSILRIRPLAAANATAVLVAAAMFPLFFFGSIYMQEIKGFSPIESGAGFLPFTISVFVGASLAQRTLPRFGARPVALVGLVLAAGGFLLATRFGTDSDYVTVLVPAFAVAGFGIGNLWLPMTMAATGSVGTDSQGLASGLANTSQQIGGALGLAVLTTVAANETESALGELGSPANALAQAQATVEGFEVAFMVGAGLILAAFTVLGLFLRKDDVEVGSVPEPIPGSRVKSVSVAEA